MEAEAGGSAAPAWLDERVVLAHFWMVVAPLINLLLMPKTKLMHKLKIIRSVLVRNTVSLYMQKLTHVLQDEKSILMYGDISQLWVGESVLPVSYTINIFTIL